MKNIYKTIFLCLLFSILCPFSSISQTAPGIEWQNTIGGSADDGLYSIQQTSDGGYILGGYSDSNISGDKTENSNGAGDYWIVKTDSLGNIQWQNTIGGSNDEYTWSVQQTSDGGYIIGGHSESNISGDKTENCMGQYDYWIVKTDTAGNLQWQNTIGGSADDYLQCIQQTSDGGYILGGYSISNISGDKTENIVGGTGFPDYWIVKTDSMGNIQWQNTIGGSNDDRLFSIEQTADGGYILGGYSLSDISGDKTENCIGGTDYWFVKTNAAGSIQWQNTIGGISNDQLYDIHQTLDGGYILAGFSMSDISGDKTENSNGLLDYWIVKADATGNIQWQNTIGGSDWDWLESIQQTADKGYIVGGYSNSNISGDKTEDCIGGQGYMDYWIVKTDTAGSIQWQKTIGGSLADIVREVKQTTDGGYMLCGVSSSNISGDKTENCLGGGDYWIVKLAPDTITSITSFQNTSSNFQINPNPFDSQSKITFNNPEKEIFLFTLFDFTGKISQTFSTTNNEIILSKGSMRAGVYLFSLVNEKTGGGWSGKVAITD